MLLEVGIGYRHQRFALAGELGQRRYAAKRCVDKFSGLFDAVARLALGQAVERNRCLHGIKRCALNASFGRSRRLQRCFKHWHPLVVSADDARLDQRVFDGSLDVAALVQRHVPVGNALQNSAAEGERRVHDTGLLSLVAQTLLDRVSLLELLRRKQGVGVVFGVDQALVKLLRRHLGLGIQRITRVQLLRRVLGLAFLRAVIIRHRGAHAAGDLVIDRTLLGLCLQRVQLFRCVLFSGQ